MATDNPCDAASARIGVLVEAKADRRLLEKMLRRRGSAVVSVDARQSPPANLDLLVVDTRALRDGVSEIRRLRDHSAPVILPVLLVCHPRRLSQALLGRSLGDTVEDILHVPTTDLELAARVDNLLRLRQLSMSQFEDHNRTRQTLAGVTLALQTLHACNEEMLRHTTEEDLLDGVCRVIAHTEGYALAWVGFARDDATEGAIEKRAIAGDASGYAETIETRWGDSALGGGPAGLALSNGVTQVVTDLLADPRTAPWRTQIDAWGVRSAIAIPLRCKQGAQGVLVVYSSRPDDFGDDARDLMERLVGNLAVGVDNCRLSRAREHQATEIRRLAYLDPLTSLPNRRHLLESMATVLADSERSHAAAVLFIDLNEFKLINDGLGHAAGDAVLAQTARRLLQSVREADLVARQGGDEFIVVMMDAPREGPIGDDAATSRRLVRGATSLANRIHRALRRPFDIGDHSHRISASIGVSLLPFHGADPETVIDHADTAMYQAKRLGDDLAFYGATMGHRRQRRLTLESRLHRALEADEFALHYQPIWQMAGGRVIGVEALLRWPTGAGEMISPGRFIPVAEEIGLIGPIGDWVISQAASQLAHWRRGGLELTMAVNLSASQLQGSRSAARLRDAFCAEGTEPEWWSLELTEDTLMRRPENVERVMRELSGDGYRLALDDFGRGYSSLARLQSLPLDTLKVDKMFMDGIASGDRSDSIVKAVVDMARHLSLTVIAEGVETAGQRTRLEALGCALGQGFLVSPARPPEEIEAMVRPGSLSSE